MRVLITGGAGFIGSHVARQLLDDGHEVVVLVRASTDTARIDDMDVERHVADIRDADGVHAAAAGCDGIVHLVALSDWKLVETPLNREIIATGMQNVVDAARVQGARLVHVSSAATIGCSPEPRVLDEESIDVESLAGFSYAQGKIEAEAVCIAAAAEGVHVSIVNPSEVIGPGDTLAVTCSNLIDMVGAGAALVVRGGTGMVHVDDVADGIWRALERGEAGRRYILSSENVATVEIARIAREVAGLAPRVIAAPRGPMLGLSRMAIRLGLPMPFEPHVIPYATRYWYVNSSRAREELGCTFRPVADAIADTLRWCAGAGMLPKAAERNILAVGTADA